MTPSEFFDAFDCFRHEEFVLACYPEAGPGSRAPERALAYHLRTGRLVRIRRGLYAVAPRGARSGSGVFPSSFLVASKIVPDAVLAYHTALEYLALAYSLRNDRLVLTESALKEFEFDGVRYRAAAFPHALDSAEKRLLGVETRDGDIRVTGVERTLVDLLDRPELAGGWEELWRSFEGAGFIDTRTVLAHVRNLASRTTAARVGWFLEEHRDRWLIPDAVFAELEQMVPRVPVYLQRSARQGGMLHARWNLIVPRSVGARRWEEAL